jgi:SAM-dependent methyltransferase
MALARLPETDLVMDDPTAVAAFDEAGRPGGALWPIYHVNAMLLARHLPRGSTFVDVFCGSARLMRHLLVGRPDLRAVGVDLSPEMLEVARVGLADAGVDDRVELRLGDAADLDELIPESVAGVVSLSALHHCPTHDALVSTLSAVARLSARTSAVVWLFDLVRPDKEDLLELLPRAHEISARQRLPEAFRRDWIASLHAGWTVEEFQSAATAAGLELTTNVGNHSQLHWHPSGTGATSGPSWTGPAPLPADLARARSLAASMDLAW